MFSWPHGGKVKAPGDRPFAVASYCDRMPKNECEKDRQSRKPVFTLIRTEKCMYYHPVSLFLKGIEIPNRTYVVCK